MIEYFMSRLNIYTRTPLTGPIAEIIIKIMVELLSTLTLVMKQINQNRPSKCVVAHIAFVWMGCSETGKEAVRREWDRGSLTKVRSSHPWWGSDNCRTNPQGCLQTHAEYEGGHRWWERHTHTLLVYSWPLSSFPIDGNALINSVQDVLGKNIWRYKPNHCLTES